MLQRINGGEWRDKHSEKKLTKNYDICQKFKETPTLVYFAKKKQIQETGIAKL